jgi:predicted phage terminase large subunit-like protein
LAVGFGRKVRNLVGTDVYRNIFPDLVLASDSKAAGRWNTSKGGDYFAIGIDGAVTGKGADVLIIDDPHSEQEAALAEINPDIYDKTYEWYTSGPRQRLQPGGAIVIVMCMTGDTRVLRPDGRETYLKDLRVGDTVATYEKEKLSTARVTNFQSSGVDNVFTVKTQSGISVRANERHPFLVEHNGARKWARLKHLKPGMSLVAAKDVRAPQGLRQNPGCATPAKPVNATTAKTPTRRINPWATTVDGRVKRAPAERLLSASVSAKLAIERNTHRQSTPLNKIAGGVSNIAMALPQQIMSGWCPNVTIAAMSAGKNLPILTRVHIGTASCVSTIATTLAKCADFCATTATSLWDTVNPLKPLSAPQLTCEFTVDPIVEIVPAGREEVFDVEIERTENFIANGLVVHNTRWSKRDLTGQVLKSEAQRGGDGWEVIEFPAILPSGNPLWPEFWSMEELSALRTELPNSKWQAQYQQAPTSNTSAIIKREWWQIWDSDVPPTCDFVLQSWDTAFEKTQRADYSALTTWGVFYQPDDNGLDQANIILLNAFRERMEFPKLKRTAVDEWKEWQPDSVIIEKKASGAPLIYEMRAMGIPVQEFTPSRGNDKISRLNAVSDLFASGRVWAPATHWAEEVIEEVAAFPGGEHDDFVDSTSLALMRFRQGGYITTNLDEPDDIVYFKSRRHQGYY